MSELKKAVLINNDDGFEKCCNISSKSTYSIKNKTKANQMSFTTKDLSKEIMERSRLRKNSLKKKPMKACFYTLNKEITVYPYKENPKSVFRESG